MKHIDLFSGIGGFALASEMVWSDVEHIFCDNEPYSQEILKKHWPHSKIYGDIRTFTSNAQSAEQQQLAVERKPDEKVSASIESDFYLLTGGFPCQPFSAAGRRRGTQDDRYLWPEMLRVIQEFNPRWVIAENVGGLISWNGGMVLEQVLSDLESTHYKTQAFVISASSVNAPHRRDRIWIVANCDSNPIRNESESEQRRSSASIPLDIIEDTEHRRSGDKKRHGYAKRASTRTSRSNTDVADTKSARLEKGRGIEEISGSGKYSSWNEPWFEAATRLCRVDDGVPRRLDRAARLKGLGNAIVPQVAAEIMRAIKIADSS